MVASAEVFERLKSDIIAGKFEILKVIDARSLADEYLTSIAPIRESLLRLSERGLLRWERNRGFFVEKISTSTANLILAQLRTAYVHSIERKEVMTFTPSMNKTSLQSDLFDNVTEYFRLQKQINSALFFGMECELITGLWERLWPYRNRYLQDSELNERLCIGARDVIRHLDSNSHEEAIRVVHANFDLVLSHLPKVSSIVQ